MNKANDFFTFNEFFLNLGAIYSPAQLQGLLVGKLCGGLPLTQQEWIDESVEFMDIGHQTLDTEQKSAIGAFYEMTQSLLDDVNFRFLPLLPGDESSIHRRSEELGAWCEGFLHGLGTSALTGDAKLSPDTADALRDLAQITQITTSAEDDLDENEAYWVELVEYVKVAVLTLYTELSDKPADTNDKVVH